MRRTSGTGLVLLCLVAVGCSSPADRYKAELKNSMRALNDLFYAMIKDKEAQGKGGGFGGGAAPPKLSLSEYNDILDRLNTLKNRLEELAPYDDRVKEKILRQYSPALESVLTNVRVMKSQLKTSEEGEKTVLTKVDDMLKTFKGFTRPDTGQEKKSTK